MGVKNNQHRLFVIHVWGALLKMQIVSQQNKWEVFKPLTALTAPNKAVLDRNYFKKGSVFASYLIA